MKRIFTLVMMSLMVVQMMAGSSEKNMQVFIDNVSQGKFGAGDTVLLSAVKGLDRFSGTRIKTGRYTDAAGQEYASMYLVAGATDVYLTSQTYDMADSTVKSGDTTYYALRSAEQLAWFSYYVNHSKDNKAANARLMADIDLSSECGSTLGNWIPIASADSGYAYNAGWTGTFDGNHHAISQLYINSDKYYQGLFGYVGGNIRQLQVTADISGNCTEPAAIAGWLCSGGRISYCTSHGSIKGWYDAGGISGFSKGTIDHCVNEADIHAAGSVAGGITGRAFGGIAYCANEGTITAEGSWIGGIAGDVEGGPTLTHSYNRGKVTGKGYCGGIVGQLWNGTVSDCYSTDSVKSLGSSDSYSSSAGAIAGYTGYGSLANCHYRSSIGLQENGAAVALKGIGNGTSYESNCYAHTDSVFATGVVARWLNGGNGTAEASGSVWGQTLGSDSYPVFKNEKNGVYQLTLINGDTVKIYANSGKLNLPVLAQTGDVAKGWYDAENNEFTGNSVLTGDTTLYATHKWWKYSITLVDTLNKGTSSMVVTEGMKSYTLPTPTKLDYNFMGWTNKNGVRFTTDSLLTSDTTLYAQWKQKQFSLTLINENADTTTKTVSNGNYTLPTPTKLDYNFMGWTNKNGVRFTTDSLLTSDTTLYAQWKQKQFSLTLIDENDTTTELVSNGNYTLSAPTKPHYDFMGWTNKNGVQFTTDSLLTSDTTLYAQWKQKQFSLTLINENADTTTKVVSNGSYTLPTPTKLHYAFTGWTNKNGVQFTTDSLLTSDTTLYANYKKQCQVFIDSVSLGYFSVGDTAFLKVTKGLDRFSGTRIKSEICIDAAGQKYAGRYVVAGDTDTYLTSQTYDMADSTVKSGDTTYYALRSAEQLAWFSYYVNHSKDNKAANARLMADIDLSSECGSTLGNWIPIASADSGYTQNAGWTGTFDGNHHAISPLYINSDKSIQGLFGYAGGNIRQLQVTADISGDGYYHAAVAGWLCSGGRICYCTSLGSVKGMGNIGGISGENDGTIDHCVNEADILHAAGGNAGGITGVANGGITYCANEGTITGEGPFIGGIAGTFAGGVTLTHSYNRGKVTGKGYCGGIVGQLGAGTVSDCYSTDSVKSLGKTYSESSSAGAIAGYIYAVFNPTLANCHYRSSMGLQENGVAVALKGIGNGTSYESNCYAHTDSVFATGVVARWLNGGNGTAEASGSGWGQTLGSDKYPVFKNEKNGVYQLTLINGDTTKKYLNSGKLNLPVIAQTGDVAKGWYDAANNAFTDNSVLTGDTTLYATHKWWKYSITLADTLNKDTSIMVVTEGMKSYTLPAPTKADYNFMGWADKNGVLFTTDSLLTSDTTLYAQWKQKQFSLTLIDENADTTTKNVSNGNYTLPVLTKADYNFMGWADKNGVLFTTDGLLTSDTTLYAQWKQKQFSLTLIDENDTTKELVSNGNYTLPAPTKQYYTFMGWSNRNGKVFDAKGTLTSDTTLYAWWTHNSCTVTYINGNDTTTATYLAGNVCDSLATPSKLNSQAIRFERWVTKDGKKFDCSDLSSDTTLYANWFMNYNLTLVYNDKSVSLSTALFEYETKFRTTDFEEFLWKLLNDSTLLNYHITGWYTKDSIRVDTLKMTSDTTLYAQLEAVKYHISYISDADTIDTTYAPLDLMRGGLLRPVKAGYAFVGWTNKNGETITSDDVESDTTLYASWVKGHTLTLVTGLAGTDYEPIADSVAAHPIAMSHYSFSYLADKTDEDKLRTYTLTGWYNSDSVRVDTLRLSSDTTLYAHYTNTMVNITYIDTTNGRNDTVRISYALSDLYNQSVSFYQPAYRKNGTVAAWKTEGGKSAYIGEIYQDTTLYLAWEEGYVVTFVCNGKRLTNTSGSEMEGFVTSMYTAPMLAEPFRDNTLLSATIEGWYNEDGERIDTIHIYSDTTYIIRLVNCKVNAIYTAGVSRDIPSSTGVLLAGKLTNWRSYVDDSLYGRYLGWYEQGTRRAVDSRYTVAGNDTVYISWARKVTFVPDNGKAAYSVMMADDTTSVLPVPTAADSVFVGWTNSKGVAVGVTLPAFALTSDTTLYAQWKQKQFSLTLIDEKETTTKMVSNGNYTLPIPTKADYNFMGWADKNGVLFTTDSLLTSDTTLYAQWKQKQFSLTLIDENADTTTKNVSNGNYTLPTPTKADYNFMGWADKNGVLFTTDSLLTSDTTLYAQWKEVISTTVPENVAENCVVYAAEGAIHIVGSDAEAMVFNVKSQSVYRGCDRVIVVRPGIYLVKVEGRCHKVIVR